MSIDEAIRDIQANVNLKDSRTVPLLRERLLMYLTPDTGFLGEYGRDELVQEVQELAEDLALAATILHIRQSTVETFLVMVDTVQALDTVIYRL